MRPQFSTVFVLGTATRLTECLILLTLALAFADNAFKFVTRPQELPIMIKSWFLLGTQKKAIRLEWKDDIMGTPIFRATVQTIDGVQISGDQGLNYDMVY